MKKYIQLIRTQPIRKLVGRYLTNKGKRLVAEGVLTPKQADEKYGKNRYTVNPDSKPFKKYKLKGKSVKLVQKTIKHST